MNLDEGSGFRGLSASLGWDSVTEDLRELEQRLEQQLLNLPGGEFGEGCLWYLCSPKCEGSKCVTVCTLDA